MPCRDFVPLLDSTEQPGGEGGDEAPQLAASCASTAHPGWGTALSPICGRWSPLPLPGPLYPVPPSAEPASGLDLAADPAKSQPSCCRHLVFQVYSLAPVQQQVLMPGGIGSCWEGGKLSLSWKQHRCLLGKYMCTSKTSPLLL